jgi:hypothetical protein
VTVTNPGLSDGPMSFWRIVFALAALFNLTIGTAALFAPELLFALLRQPPLPYFLFVRIMGALVAIFGVGYAMVAAQPQQNRGIVWLGAIGKPVTPAILWLYVRAGIIPMTTFWLGFGDLIFAGLFAVYLLSIKARRF